MSRFTNIGIDLGKAGSAGRDSKNEKQKEAL